ncbi:endo-1,4-beta-xylanase [Xylanibacter oryzae]|nr:endo-1,4-beta-xylanase [Xylanibacter oryzae]
MKYYNKFLLGAISLVAFASCADNNSLDFTPAVGKSDSLVKLSYLNNYDVLKKYVDRTANPNFKLGTGVDASDFSSKGTVYALTVGNFDEITAGNAMKYGSCVADNGNMDFGAVKKFVSTAKDADVSIFGHTLAWHSQQNNKYLNSLVPNSERYMHITTTSVGTKPNPWDWGITYNLDSPLEVGKSYTLSLSAKSSPGTTVWFWPSCSAGTMYLNPQFSVGTKWGVYSITFTPDKPIDKLSYEFGQLNGSLYLDNISLTKDGSSTNLIVNPNFDNNDISRYSKPSYLNFTYAIDGVIPTKILTDQEKKDTITWAMGNWIQGMMNACKGYVKAWDVVNEPLSGVDKDGDGFYDLQSATRGTVSDNDASANFYWQDYMGDLDYVRTAVADARKYFVESGGNASDLKLFINDYNLETFWDHNQKLISLISWIGKWEADGTTKIDGIGTQMHVSYNEDPIKQKSQEDAIVNMFKIMAATKKLVRISELDMGILDANGNKVLTPNVTDAQMKEQAAFYQFIVKAYFDNVPAAQRYGIAQWAQTDSPSTTGAWRANEPIGLWNGKYDRKRAYAGFADGLAGKVVYPAE